MAGITRRRCDIEYRVSISLVSFYLTPVLSLPFLFLTHSSLSQDDSTRYRTPAEIAYWAESDNPVTRMRALLEKRGLWDAAKETAARDQARKDVLGAFNAAEATKKPAVEELFTDVYDQPPPHLVEQREQLKQHLAKHGEHYALHEFAPDAKL